MKKIILSALALFLLAGTISHAQKNRLEIGVEGFTLLGGLDKLPWGKKAIFHALALRDVYKGKLFLEAQYTKNPFKAHVFVLRDITDNDIISKKNPGTGTFSNLERGRQHFIDLGLRYNLVDHSKAIFSISLSPSLVFGKAHYIDWLISELTGEVSVHELAYETELFWGGKASANYDYFLLKKKVNIGVNVTARYYAQSGNPEPFPMTVSYGVHMGYNF